MLHEFSNSDKHQEDELRAQLFTDNIDDGIYRHDDLRDAAQAYERSLFPVTDRVPWLFSPRERFVVSIDPAAMRLLEQLNQKTPHQLSALEELLNANRALSAAILRPTS